ncbi:MAG: transglutaminase N-terminal domain-containing protein [Nitrospiria bacterium]
MLFDVSHTTSYVYSKAVFLEPHIVRLRPRCDATQHLIDFSLTATPRPSGRSEYLNLDGNSVSQLWFDGLTDHLEIVTAFSVETLQTNPFDYLISNPSVLKLPMRYPSALAPGVTPYLGKSETKIEAVEKFAKKIADEAGWEPIPFLSALVHRLSRDWKQIVREEGDPLPSSITLDRLEGSCRDITQLFLDACRALGLATRFVSGYQEGDPIQEIRYLHEWAEVYILGGGWRGYDPTLGLAVSNRHIAVAAGRTHQSVSPVSGAFRGSDVQAVFYANITMGLR